MTTPVDPLLQGDKLARPVNAPGQQAATPGVQAGISNTVVTANRVIIFGANGELLVYSGTPAFGNLLASISGTNATDQYGNFVVAGVTVYGTGNSAIQMYLQGGLPVLFLVPSGVVSATLPPNLFSESLSPGAANQRMQATLSTGKENGLDDAALQLFSESADATIAASALIEFGGTVTAKFTKLLTQMLVPVVGTVPGSSTAETWHLITLDAGWTAGSPAPQYRMDVTNSSIQFTGIALHASFTTGTNINGSNPLPAGYRPAGGHYYRSNDQFRAGVQYLNTGILEAFPQAAGNTQVDLDGIVALL
jgi:hypothetical protein